MALVIDRAILELLKISPDTPLELSTDGRSLIVTPVHDEQKRKEYEMSLKPEKRTHKYGVVLRDVEDGVELVVNGESKGKIDKQSIVDFFNRMLKRKK